MKALTLAESKAKISKDNGFDDWHEFVEYVEEGHGTAEQYYDEAALLHSLSCQEALREKIASEAKVISDTSKLELMHEIRYDVNRDAIRNTPLIEG